jgi:hypothetical protein
MFSLSLDVYQFMELLKRVGNLIIETWSKMIDLMCTFHELIMANEISLKLKIDLMCTFHELIMANEISLKLNKL